MRLFRPSLRTAARLAMALLCLPVDTLATGPAAGPQAAGPPKHQVGRIRGARPNRHGNHYLFGMSAIPLEKGEGFYKNTLLSVNAVNYGLTRHLSVGGGVELLSVITGREAGPVFFLDAKLAADISEVMHVGVNAMYINYPFPANLDDPQFTERRPGFSVITAAATIGDADHQITFSGGISNDLDAGRVRPAASVAGMARFFPRAALISENWLFFDDPDDYAAWSLGVRFIGQTVAVDVALVSNKQIREELLPIGMPIVNVAVAF